MLPINQCLFCKGEILEKEVTEVIKSNDNTANLKVNAFVCKNCKETYYYADTIRKFEENLKS